MLTITATFEDGVLKPTQPLNLPAQAKVRITIEESFDGAAKEERERAWRELRQLWQEVALDSRGDHLSRDELHERR